MAILKCKMCGGELNFEEGMTVCECEYCGSKQTIPSVDDEKIIKLYDRANRLRMANEFDKAGGVYESIIEEKDTEAEAYWGLLLCKFGIEYVDDPATGDKVPTCHRSSFESIMDDPDFELVMENADSISRSVYRESAKQIEEIRKGIIEVSEKEEPYDIFICYKETDENGDRTIDSVLAQDVYDALVEKGYKVFFSRITLEDKLGREYEPYIFAALNSAKIMLAFGTSYDYYNAVWVKNEWSRFLKLMAKDKEKHLIPCYKDIDAYDMPKEFKHLQAQDMGKIGAIQDLLRGIEKLIGEKITDAVTIPVQQTLAVSESDVKMQAALKRGWLALEDENWQIAKGFFNQALEYDAEHAMAYLGLACVHKCVKTVDDIVDYDRFEDDSDYQKFLRFAGADEENVISRINGIKQFREEKRKEEETAARIQEELRYKEAERKWLEWIQQFTEIRKGFSKYGGLIHSYNDNAACLKLDGSIEANLCLEIDDRQVMQNWKDVVEIFFGDKCIFGLKLNGRVVSSGANEYGRCEVNEWRDIKKIVTTYHNTIGIKNDGTVVTAGLNDKGQCNVGSWTDIVAVAASGSHTIGLKSDGRVVAAGYNLYGQCNVEGWSDIVDIAASDDYSVGLKKDGTVLAIGDNEAGQCNVGEWRKIVAIYAEDNRTVGLCADGRVHTIGYGRCQTDQWENIVKVVVSRYHIAGLCSDGRVVMEELGKPIYYLEGFNNIVDIALGYGVVGVKSNGDIVVFERDLTKRGSQSIRGNIFDNTNGFVENDISLLQQRKERVKENLVKEKQILNNQLTEVKGLFAAKRKKEIEERLREIDEDLTI